MIDTIFLADKNYVFGLESGVGVNSTPWKQLTVETKDRSLADKYVVDIRLITEMPEYNGTPVENKVTAIKINFHGYSNINIDEQTVTEYIQTLNEAVQFAEKVQCWFKDMGLDIPFINK